MEKSLHSFFHVGATFLSVSIILLCNDPVVLSDRGKLQPLFYLSHIDRHVPPGCIEANSPSPSFQNRKESNSPSGISSDLIIYNPTLPGLRDGLRTYQGRAPPKTVSREFDGAGSRGKTSCQEFLPVITIFPSDENSIRRSAALLRVPSRIAHGDFPMNQSDSITDQILFAIRPHGYEWAGYGCNTEQGGGTSFISPTRQVRVRYSSIA